MLQQASLGSLRNRVKNSSAPRNILFNRDAPVFPFILLQDFNVFYQELIVRTKGRFTFSSRHECPFKVLLVDETAIQASVRFIEASSLLQMRQEKD